MEAIRSDAEGALNQFVKEQQAAPGEATLTEIQFDAGVPDWYQVRQKAVPIAKAERIRLNPRGSTALLDAVGRALSACRTCG